ncbi:HAD-IIIA family hydrolase [Leptolyngbya sp. FACHB-16]|uniref:HAD-IIIA family hydrolase n=1 Tax=unclassified Leptolyngbya TaxID=2650499 RepID=UPI00168294E8|nr:HAD-IIIA family hydrolase [Leptolyngbya sp. FACHB-16]MBD2156270.1 HAD-IIIA family hydrolase [Leptolyngbya sp. FACHB-16]
MKLLILDKDGTLVKSCSGQEFIQAPDDQELFPGVYSVLQKWRDDGWKMAIASNQGGVAEGYKSLESAIEEVRYCLYLGSPMIEVGCLCPDFEGVECYEVRKHAVFTPKERGEKYQALEGTFRKPMPGMLQYLILQFLPLPPDGPIEVLYVGDRPEDESAALAAGVEFLWAHEWRGDRQ